MSFMLLISRYPILATVHDMIYKVYTICPREVYPAAQMLMHVYCRTYRDAKFVPWPDTVLRMPFNSSLIPSIHVPPIDHPF